MQKSFSFTASAIDCNQRADCNRIFDCIATSGLIAINQEIIILERLHCTLSFCGAESTSLQFQFNFVAVSIPLSGLHYFQFHFLGCIIFISTFWVALFSFHLIFKVKEIKNVLSIIFYGHHLLLRTYLKNL